ncbi:putative lipase atg15 [Dimargaris verticillata]|uniref:triacylglycerol lipase n=1 Tax=Dimargaris verticillata TaxID=2761393 RepID=A0A9W8EFT2_9FUNG|nr:putative lipase atg15 [Dimargaris verticillata]
MATWRRTDTLFLLGILVALAVLVTYEAWTAYMTVLTCAFRSVLWVDTQTATTTPALHSPALALRHVYHRGTTRHADSLLRADYQAQDWVRLAQLDSEAADTPALKLSGYSLKRARRSRLPYPTAQLTDFIRYAAERHPVLPDSSVSSNSDPLSLAEMYPLLANASDAYAWQLPFRHQYHRHALSRAAPTFWANPWALPGSSDDASSGLHDIPVPDVQDNHTVSTLAEMAYNAYNLPDSDDWFDLRNDSWSHNRPFGWGSDGLRGYVFADEANSTVVIAIKGTSATFFLGGSSETSARDKLNDNRLFSCCCARVDYTWSTVCDCYQKSGVCSQECVEQSLEDDSLYFQAAADLFITITKAYPKADIWLTGHSLGGALAGLMSLTFGHPVVTFESPGEQLAARRLHLPLPLADDAHRAPIWHFGHNADPIYLGICRGASSSCYYGGYAMESRCHSGNTCIFDTVKYKKWSPDMRKHRLKEILQGIFFSDEVPWPTCAPDLTCQDCQEWSFE